MTSGPKTPSARSASKARLVTDSDCVTLFLAVNTEEILAKRDAADQAPERLAELRKYKKMQTRPGLHLFTASQQ